MKQIPLTRGRFALVDDIDYKRISKMKWSFHCDYATNSSYVKGSYNKITKGKWKFTRMHRLIMGAAEGVEIDHINGDKLDNRRSNLRTCTRSQNMANLPVRKNNRSGFKGVSIISSGRYRANITINYKQYSIGVYDTPEEAHLAYKAKAEELFSEFAHA